VFDFQLLQCAGEERKRCVCHGAGQRKLIILRSQLPFSAEDIHNIPKIACCLTWMGATKPATAYIQSGSAVAGSRSPAPTVPRPFRRELSAHVGQVGPCRRRQKWVAQSGPVIGSLSSRGIGLLYMAETISYVASIVKCLRSDAWNDRCPAALMRPRRNHLGHAPRRPRLFHSQLHLAHLCSVSAPHRI